MSSMQSVASSGAGPGRLRGHDAGLRIETADPGAVRAVARELRRRLHLTHTAPPPLVIHTLPSRSTSGAGGERTRTVMRGSPDVGRAPDAGRLGGQRRTFAIAARRSSSSASRNTSVGAAPAAGASALASACPLGVPPRAQGQLDLRAEASVGPVGIRAPASRQPNHLKRPGYLGGSGAPGPVQEGVQWRASP